MLKCRETGGWPTISQFAAFYGDWQAGESGALHAAKDNAAGKCSAEALPIGMRQVQWRIQTFTIN
jgi:hypothetical protein